MTRYERIVRPSITIPLDPDTERDDDGRELEELIERVMPRQAIEQQNLHTEKGILGRGACSIVQRARHLYTRELFAVKIFNVYDKERARQLVRELSTLYQVNCPSLVGFYGVYKNEDSIHVVLEYMDRGSLHDIVHNLQHDPLPEHVIAAVTFQILWGLGYLHYEHKLHRDVKPSNILVNASGEVKLTDFGIARELGEDELATTMVGTFRYMSPERLRGENYGAASDIWSLGLVLIELATRRTPFVHCNNQIDLNQMLEETNIDRDLIPHGQYSPHFCEFVASCLRPRPDQRLPAAVLLDSPLFAFHGIDELDVAVEVFKDWLDNNPEDEAAAVSASSAANDQTAPRMLSTWKSSDGESSDDGENGSFGIAGIAGPRGGGMAGTAAGLHGANGMGPTGIIGSGAYGCPCGGCGLGSGSGSCSGGPTPPAVSGGGRGGGAADLASCDSGTDAGPSSSGGPADRRVDPGWVYGRERESHNHGGNSHSHGHSTHGHSGHSTHGHSGHNGHAHNGYSGHGGGLRDGGHWGSSSEDLDRFGGGDGGDGDGGDGDGGDGGGKAATGGSRKGAAGSGAVGGGTGAPAFESGDEQPLSPRERRSGSGGSRRSSRNGSGASASAASAGGGASTISPKPHASSSRPRRDRSPFK